MENERPELQKHTLFLYKGDYEKLRNLYPEVGAAVAVRKLIQKYLREVEAKTQGSAVQLEDVDV